MPFLRRLAAAVAVLAALGILASGCSRKHLLDPPHDSPRDPLTPGAPPEPLKPGAVTVEAVAANAVTLHWTMSDSTGVGSYHVFVLGPSDPSYRLVTTTAIQRGTIGGLQTGTTYLFKVAGVNTAGLEGPQSDPVGAKPVLLSIVINGDAPFTNNLNVSVQGTASGFNQIRVAPTTDSLSRTTYTSLGAGTVGFSLTGPDGPKTLYGQFRDSNTLTESGVVSDDITLDRVAQILTVSQNTGGAVKTAGQVIHFRIQAGENGGSGTVDIGTARTGIRLFNDGTNGDSLADDNVLAVDYVVEPTFDANNAQVVGHFTDRAGNSAPLVLAAGLVTVVNPPPPVTLQSAVKQSSGRVLLQWTTSSASDFNNYRVWHASTSPVVSAPSRFLVTTISTRNTNTVVDSSLVGGSNYFFMVEVVDNAGNASQSNELSTTAEPAAIVTSPRAVKPEPLPSGGRRSGGP